MQNVILQDKKSRRARYAMFDFDWTLVKPKDGRKFPKDVSDWMYLRPSVPDVLRQYAKTHQIVIVTDQSKEWKIDQIREVLADLAIEHITVVIGFETQKPDTSLFESEFPTIDRTKAFFVGDAAGRPGDWADKDKQFAKGLGVPFYTPEEMFPLAEPKPLSKAVAPSKNKEVVIMVGYPASGKSTIATSVLKDYYRVDGDKLKTAAAMIRDAERHVATDSIVFDSTAGTKEKRAVFIEFAQKHNIPVRVFWVQTPIDVAMERNKQRGATAVPDVVFYVYRKKFEEPTAEEGIQIVKIPGV